jgi:hypothetical protein
LDTYRAQRGYTSHHHHTNDTTMTHYDDMEQDGDHATELEDQINPLGQKKLTSLRDKGKRAQKPKAKSVNDGLVSSLILYYNDDSRNQTKTLARHRLIIELV